MEKGLTFDQLPQAVHQMNKKLETIEKLLLAYQSHQQPEPKEKLLTVLEASEFLSLTVPTIYSKVSRGELPVMKRSKRLYFSNIELMEYLKAGRKRTNSELEAVADKYISNNSKP